MAPPYTFVDPAQILGKIRSVTVAATKPKMRGMLASQIKLHVFIAVALSAAGGLAFKVLVADVRRAKYTEFYRTFDAEKEFEQMRRKRLFQSC